MEPTLDSDRRVLLRRRVARRNVRIAAILVTRMVNEYQLSMSLGRLNRSVYNNRWKGEQLTAELLLVNPLRLFRYCRFTRYWKR